MASSDPPVLAWVRVRKQSSMAADRGGGGNGLAGGAEGSEQAAGIADFQLMYMAHEATRREYELLDAGADPNFRDLDGRTAMHIPACEEHAVALQLLFERGAGVGRSRGSSAGTVSGQIQTLNSSHNMFEQSTGCF